MSAIRLLVLGTIRRRGIAHGYRVYRDLTSWRVETWTSVKPGSIYHAIAQLESQGFILPTDSSQGAKLGPSRTEYKLTSQGEEEFTSLLETAIKAIDIEILAAGIAFMEMLPRDRVIALLNERLTSLQAIPIFLKTLPTEPIPSEPSKHPELIGLWVGYVESAITSTQSLIKALENGKYAFLNERKGDEFMEKTQCKATLNDGSTIDIEVQGKGPALLISVNPVPIEGAQADEMRKWGVDPALGRSLIDGLCNTFRVVAFDYEGHLMKTPQPDTLTSDHIANDLLAVADAANVRQFAYYGYSWLALCGMQLAIRTDRLTALMMGGFPPIGGPYKEMLTVTQATHEMASAPKEPSKTSPSSADEFDWNSIEITLTEGQTRQFLTLYQALQDFDDRAAQAKITCPRLCFAGSADTIVYGERWKNAVVSMVAPLIEQKAEIEALGWEVRVLDGLDHTGAMQTGTVLPVILPWLISRLNA